MNARVSELQLELQQAKANNLAIHTEAKELLAEARTEIERLKEVAIRMTQERNDMQKSDWPLREEISRLRAALENIAEDFCPYGHDEIAKQALNNDLNKSSKE